MDVWQWDGMRLIGTKYRMVGMSGGEIFHEMMLRLDVKQICK